MITVTKRNEAFLQVHSDDSGILMELSEHFTFYVPGYKFMPAFRNKMWDGKIRLFNSRNQLLPYGLLNNLQAFAKAREYEFVVSNDIQPRSIQIKELAAHLEENKLPFAPRDYQLQAWHHAMVEQRAILVSPTGSGKSLMIYLMMSFFLNAFEEKVLIIVPTTSLVEQLFKDFKDYSVKNSFDTEENVHRIYSGKERNDFSQRVVITTWQSAIRCAPEWFEQFGMVVGDEAHTFKAKSLNTIMERLQNAYFRIGTTGTLDGTKVHELVLSGHFGEPLKVVSTSELIANQTLADLEIKCLVLKYPDAVKKKFGKQKYADEIDFLVSNEARNRFICNLSLDQKGNTLVLYNLVEKHGKPLHDMITRGATDGRKVFFVSGAVSADERERIRELTEKEENAIIVASMGTFSTGINIKSLANIVLASPTKSQIRLLQSIGRGLRKSANGQGTVVYDIADNLSWKSRKNYTLGHAIARVEIYQKEDLNFKLYEIPIGSE